MRLNHLSILRYAVVTIVTLYLDLITAHTIIVYPGYRGNNLHSNGTVEETNGLGMGLGNGSQPLWPYGMQWDFPCTFTLSLPFFSFYE